MSRAETLLEEAITITNGLAASLADDGLKDRVAKLAAELEGQRGKFFYKSLAGVPGANKCKKAAQAAAALGPEADRAALDTAIASLESEVAAMVKKSDAPGTVLT